MHIDMHIHTAHSDGRDSVAAVLKNAKKEKLSAISITDHNSVKAYNELSDKTTRSLFDGTVVTGTEIAALHHAMPIEILGYNFDVSAMDSEISKLRLPNEEKYRRFQSEMLLKKLKTLGIPFDISDPLKREYFLSNWRNIFFELQSKHKSFLTKLHPSFAEDRRSFFRNGMNNINSDVSIDYYGFLPTAETAIKSIHESGGKAVLAHPYEYGRSSSLVLANLPDGLDGIECYHPSANEQKRRSLIQMCRSKDLIITGGSDAHGYKNKMNSENVPEELLGPIIGK